MTVEQMRSEIEKYYNTRTWKTKVKKMPEKQVIAVYHEFMERALEKKIDESVKDIIQLSFDDILPDVMDPTKSVEYNFANSESTIRMQYVDVSMGGEAVCPKEVLLSGWQGLVGKYIIFNQVKQKVKGVRLVAGFIFVDLINAE